MAQILPAVSWAVFAMYTAMHTSRLQKMASTKAFAQGRLFLLAATFAVYTAKSPPPMFSWPKNAMSAASATAPTKLPRNTRPQLRSSSFQVILPETAAVTISALPVNSSVPRSTTIIRPTGKMRPETRRTMPASSRAWAAVEEATAPRPMNRPAATAKRNIRQAGEVAFAMEALA